MAGAQTVRTGLLAPTRFRRVTSLRGIPRMIRCLGGRATCTSVLRRLTPRRLREKDVRGVLAHSLCHSCTGLCHFYKRGRHGLVGLHLGSCRVRLVGCYLEVIVGRCRGPFSLSCGHPFFSQCSRVSVRGLVASHAASRLVRALGSARCCRPLGGLGSSPSIALCSCSLTLGLCCFAAL